MMRALARFALAGGILWLGGSSAVGLSRLLHSPERRTVDTSARGQTADLSDRLAGAGWVFAGVRWELKVEKLDPPELAAAVSRLPHFTSFGGGLLNLERNRAGGIQSATYIGPIPPGDRNGRIVAKSQSAGTTIPTGLLPTTRGVRQLAVRLDEEGSAAAEFAEAADLEPALAAWTAAGWSFRKDRQVSDGQPVDSPAAWTFSSPICTGRLIAWREPDGGRCLFLTVRESIATEHGKSG